jgi:hypothetical protein
LIPGNLLILRNGRNVKNAQNASLSLKTPEQVHGRAKMPVEPRLSLHLRLQFVFLVLRRGILLSRFANDLPVSYDNSGCCFSRKRSEAGLG